MKRSKYDCKHFACMKHGIRMAKTAQSVHEQGGDATQPRHLPGASLTFSLYSDSSIICVSKNDFRIFQTAANIGTLQYLFFFFEIE